MRPGIRTGLAGLLWMCSIATLAALDEPVPFKLYRKYSIVCTGSIGTHRDLNFIMDTGANPSVIHRRMARKLKARGGSSRLFVFNQHVEAKRVHLPSVEIGPIQAQSVEALTGNLSFIEEGLGVRVDGVIGMDVLAQRNFTIDYAGRRISLRSEDAGLAYAPFDDSGGLIVIQLEVRGQSIRLMLDTGAKDLILFDNRVRERLDGIRFFGVTSFFTNLSGQVPLEQVRLWDVRLGEAHFGDLTAYLLDTGGRELHGIDGLIGPASLGLKRVSLDFRRKLLGWAR